MPLDIAVIGAGYVGLVAAACFADAGHRVVCIDVDEARVAMLRAGVLPMFEPALDAIVGRALHARRLTVTTDLSHAAHADAAFVAVGTPRGPDGAPDVRAVLDVAESLGRHAARELVLVVKSTVPVGTTDAALARARTAARVPIHGCFNPEFLREGAAVDEFVRPDRVVIGTDSAHARRTLTALYETVVSPATPILHMDARSAELTKYAANAMLATRIAVMNDVAGLCEQVGASIDDVRLGVGSDVRLGPAFLAPGPGYGGSCFPKDVQALVWAGARTGAPQDVLAAVDAANARHRRAAFRKLRTALARDGIAPRDATVAVWGLAFKPGTDDLRESPALALLDELLAEGAQVVAHDPVAMHAVTRRYATSIATGRLRLVAEPLRCLDGAHALALMTEWDAYRSLPLAHVASRLARPIVVDMRNVWRPADAAAHGVTYHSVGRMPVVPATMPAASPVAAPAPALWA
ncbi:MAG: UDP-glucose/GDP-mannose dehydrogenase family protein [Gemmatirosa sp.]|nr:UDP-glucose/GDP-mannose dehydrogenase family protein [Gemmatirosa sp.]